MIYKRATAKLRTAGIENIVIKKGLYGPYPIDVTLKAQRSMCYNTAEEAAEAVIAGFRPTQVDTPPC